MDTKNEARRAARIRRMRALEEEHREALNRMIKRWQKRFMQGQALYIGAKQEEQEAMEAIKTRLSAETALYVLNLKGTISRMQRRNHTQEEN